MADLREIMSGIYKTRGTLTPKIVLEEARNPSHPLHDRFEWDDATAAEKFRIRQAHDLIVSVKVSYKLPNEPTKDVRAFHAVRGDNINTYEYRPVEEVAQDDFMRKLVLRDMERDWKTLQERYERFREFWPMVQLSVPPAT
jgi:hypothetical protein